MPMPKGNYNIKSLRTPEYTDERGRYKLCGVCNSKIYYDDFAASRVGKRGGVDILWKCKSLCSDECKKRRKEETLTKTKTILKKIKNEERICAMCGNKYVSGRLDLKFCNNTCANLDFSFNLIAKELGIDKEWLKDHLIDLSEKIQNGEIHN